MPETESSRERLDRNLEQLMTELRVAMPGVQILFAFLLSVPFTQRFGDVTSFQRDVYLVSLVAAGVATGFLIAPTAYHRMTFRRGEKRHLVFTANRWVIDRAARARGLDGRRGAARLRLPVRLDGRDDRRGRPRRAVRRPVVRLPAHAPSADGGSRVAPGA